MLPQNIWIKSISGNKIRLLEKRVPGSKVKVQATEYSLEKLDWNNISHRGV